MTPPHGTDSLGRVEREARTAQEAHMFECWLAEGGPGRALSQKLDEVKWFLAKLIGALALLAAIVPTGVVLWTHYHQPSKAQALAAPALINSAHAETKGTAR